MFARPYEPVPLGAAVRDTLAALSTATLTIQLQKRGIQRMFMPGVRPLAPGAKLVGPASTLRNIPVREDVAQPGLRADPDYPQRRAVEATPAGAVLVIDAGGDRSAGQLGDILIARLAVRGVAGVVTDGCMRDVADIADMRMPVFAAGAAAPAALSAHYAVALDEPIGCGGVAVFPGDIVVGDADGVVIIPSPLAAEVAADGLEQEAYERFVQRRVAEGASIVGLYPGNDAARAAFACEREGRDQAEH